MVGIFDFAGVPYDIDDLKIAVNNGDGTFGAVVDVPSIDMFTVEWATKNAEGRGDGGITVLASGIEKANITMRNVGIKRSIMSKLFPADNYNTSTTPTQVADFYIESGRPFPYFGAAIRVLDNESPTNGGVILFFPRVKIMQNISWRFEYNVIVTPEMTGEVVPDTVLTAPSGRLKFVHMKAYESDVPAISSFPLIAS